MCKLSKNPHPKPGLESDFQRRREEHMWAILQFKVCYVYQVLCIM